MGIFFAVLPRVVTWLPLLALFLLAGCSGPPGGEAAAVKPSLQRLHCPEGEKPCQGRCIPAGLSCCGAAACNDHQKCCNGRCIPLTKSCCGTTACSVGQKCCNGRCIPFNYSCCQGVPCGPQLKCCYGRCIPPTQVCE